ncbi:MMPL family transporter [Paraburkholderia rhizosphaerae]|uniref:Putative exporter n=1 Tax=Paraburkholderia rhizosphaerae TaxID=480658 RepID=A0A4R8LMB5_9BURK|nr:MMPL family transporter [Paraburkholderia rhizosphaerae]TDY46435.1 putative exporter [Paraburkholderia rhizosphaerae]
MDLLARERLVRQRWGIRAAWLVLALAAALFCAWRFAASSPLQTNLLELLPETEADPVAEKAVDTLAAALGERTVFVVTSRDAGHAKTAAVDLAAMLTASGAFRSVTAKLPPFDLSQIGTLYLPYRFGLLTPADRAALTDGSLTLHDALARRLYNPLRGGLATPLADDPFGWLEHWLAALPLATSNLDIEDGLLVAHRGDATSVLVVATLPGSAYETKVEQAVLRAVSRGDAQLRTQFPDVSLARTGAVFYAQAARSAAERDVHLIAAVSVFGIALLMLWIFRSPRLLALGFVSTALGIVCALAATLLVFGKLHLVTLVFGASLIGEAVDYSIQYFVVYLGAARSTRERWNPWRGARAVRPALTVALTTSLLGYAILACVPFPALRQIACFAIVGLCAAFASVLTLLPALLPHAPKRDSRRLFDAAARLLASWQRCLGGPRAWLVAALLLIVSAPGWLRLSGDDDIHLLVQRDASLAAQEQTIRVAIGVDNTAQFFVVRAETPEIVLQRAEALGVALDRLGDTQSTGGWQSVTSFVPSAQRQADDRTLLAHRVFDDPAALRATLIAAGFRDSVADAWLAAYRQSANAGPLTLDRWLAAPWSRPFRHLWLGATDTASHGYAAIVIPQRVTDANRHSLEAVAHASSGVVFVDKAASVSKLFGEYRAYSMIWLAGALVLVLLLSMFRYGLHGGATVMLPVLLAVVVTLAVFGYARIPLNLFNCLALMLVLGVGSNYAVFLREGCVRDGADLGAVWTGVLLSAATTLLSFGTLGASSMPALHSFGVTLALGIAVSALLAPIGMPAHSRRTA